MKPRNKRDAHLKRRFDAATTLSGEVLGRQIREERRLWKKTMSKQSRKLDRDEIDEELDLLDLDQ